MQFATDGVQLLQPCADKLTQVLEIKGNQNCSVIFLWAAIVK